MKRGPATAAAIIGFFLASAAHAADIEGDLHCVAVMATAVDSAQGEERAGVIAGMMYFIGLLDGEAPGIDLQRELNRVANAMSPDDVAAEGRRCGAILTVKGSLLQQFGDGAAAAK